MSHAFFVVMLAATSMYAQTQNAAKTDQATIVRVAAKAAIAALNFPQGDTESFMRARVNFTPEGWKEFMRHMDGFLDQKGAPTFTSYFVPSKWTTVLSENRGGVHFRVPGTLTQSNKLGRTTYRAAIEVYAAGGKSVKIQRLEQITCVGAFYSL